MNKENTANSRHVRAVTTLPLLTLTESIKFLNDEIEAVFVDGEEIPIDDRDTVVRQLACASGGHPRSIEYIIRNCNDHIGSVKTIKLKEVIDYVSRKFCEMYNEDNCVQLLTLTLQINCYGKSTEIKRMYFYCGVTKFYVKSS